MFFNILVNNYNIIFILVVYLKIGLFFTFNNESLREFKVLVVWFNNNK